MEVERGSDGCKGIGKWGRKDGYRGKGDVYRGKGRREGILQGDSYCSHLGRRYDVLQSAGVGRWKGREHGKGEGITKGKGRATLFASRDRRCD